MPRNKLGFAVPATARRRLLTFEELLQVSAAFVDEGVQKIRLTGGEPLVRRDLPELVTLLSKLPVKDLCLTTNGSLLQKAAASLSAAGLKRVTVSLDALDEPTFSRMTDSQTRVSQILAGIDAARQSGLEPVKINMVVQRGVNEHAIIPMADWARREHLELRFIEYMDVGCSNGWQLQDVVGADEVRKTIHQMWPLRAIDRAENHATANYYCYEDRKGKVGFVASITRPFCGNCTRARVSSTGELFPCLFAGAGLDLAALMRRGSDLRGGIRSLWKHRSDRYSETRFLLGEVGSKPEMSAIGG